MCLKCYLSIIIKYKILQYMCYFLFIQTLQFFILNNLFETQRHYISRIYLIDSLCSAQCLYEFNIHVFNFLEINITKGGRTCKLGGAYFKNKVQKKYSVSASVSASQCYNLIFKYIKHKNLLRIKDTIFVPPMITRFNNNKT